MVRALVLSYYFLTNESCDTEIQIRHLPWELLVHGIRDLCNVRTIFLSLSLLAEWSSHSIHTHRCHRLACLQ